MNWLNHGKDHHERDQMGLNRDQIGIEWDRTRIELVDNHVHDRIGVDLGSI